MSAFMNGSGSDSGATGTSLSGALAAGNDLTKGTANAGDMSGLTGPLGSTGLGNATADQYAFQLPSGMQAAISAGTGGSSTGDTAGLTGVGSGMTMPDYASAMTGSGTYDSNNTNWKGLAAAGQKLASSVPQQPKIQGGTGRVTMKPENFSAPVVALPMASGSAAGNSLLQMMQRYQPGNVVGTNTGSGFGIR